MTTQEQIQFITKKAIEANHSILDLVFGCRFLDDGKEHLIYFAEDGHEMLETVAMTNWYGVMELKKHHIGREYVEGKNPELGIPKIIGREIRLADVLLAIDKISSQYSVGADGRFTVLDITKDGTSGLEWVKESNGVLALTWNLLKDSLFSQSPETIEFIFNLLNK